MRVGRATLGDVLDPKLELPLPMVISLLYRLDIFVACSVSAMTCRYRLGSLLQFVPERQREWEIMGGLGDIERSFLHLVLP